MKLLSTFALLSAGLLNRASAFEPRKLCEEEECVCDVSETSPLDVVLLVDNTGSYYSPLVSLKASIDDIVAAIIAIDANAYIGVAGFRDIPDRVTYQLFEDLTDDGDDVKDAVNHMVATGGGDFPEAQLLALNMTAGLMSWRAGSQRIILLWTDAAFSQPCPAETPGWPCKHPYTGPPWSVVNATLAAEDIAVVGLQARTSSAAKADLEFVSVAAGTDVDCDDDGDVDVLEGNPLVCNSDGLELEIVFPALVAGALGCVIEDVDYSCALDPVPSLPVEPDIDYTVGDISLDFSTETINGGDPAVTMNFTYNGGAGGVVFPIRPSFQVLITQKVDGLCSASGEIIAKTAYAHISEVATDDDVDSGVFLIMVNPVGGEPTVEISIDLSKLEAPFYEEGVDCPVGSEGPCGLIDICIEAQVLFCNRKVDFVDVNVQLKVDLSVECDEECEQVILERDEVVVQTGFVDPGDLDCKPCYNDDDEYFVTSEGRDPDFLTVNQGDSVLTCLELEPNGACVREIVDLDLLVERDEDLWKRYCIISSDPADDCLFLVDHPSLSGNPDYEPTLPFYDLDDAALNFLVPGEELQLLDPEGTVKAHFNGKVLIGLGCCCDDPIPVDCVCEDVGRRELEEARNLQVQVTGIQTVDFQGSDYTLKNAPAPDDGSNCGLFGLL